MRKRILLVCGMIFAASIFGSEPAEDFQSAMKLYNGGKFAEAEEAFTKLSGQNTSQRVADESLAYAAYSAGQQKNTGKAMEYAEKIKDKYLNMFCRMKLLEIQRKWGEIISLSKDEDFDKWPESMAYDAFFCRGNNYLRTKDAEKAEKDFLSASKNTVEQEKKVAVYQSLGMLYGEVSKDEQKALNAYAEVIKIMTDPKPSPAGGYLLRALMARAKILASQGKSEEAFSELEKLKSFEFKDPYWTCALQFSYGEVYEILGKNTEALDSYRKAAAVANAPGYFVKVATQKITDLEKKAQK